jgi:hypothetical protein
MSASAPTRAAAAPAPGEGRVVAGVPPFDAGRLDALLGEAGVDAVVTTSRQAAQCMLGGYSFPSSTTATRSASAATCPSWSTCAAARS